MLKEYNKCAYSINAIRAHHFMRTLLSDENALLVHAERWASREPVRLGLEPNGHIHTEM